MAFNEIDLFKTFLNTTINCNEMDFWQTNENQLMDLLKAVLLIFPLMKITLKLTFFKRKFFELV